VLRWNEMRDICPLSSGRWHEPHAFCTVASVIGMPSSGLAVGAEVGCCAWEADSIAPISRTVAAAKTCLSMGPRLAVILTQATLAQPPSPPRKESRATTRGPSSGRRFRRGPAPVGQPARAQPAQPYQSHAHTGFRLEA